jgi:hypothetical protein
MIGLVMSVSAGAHHSTAMYDHEKVMTMTGVVRQFQWTNPHCYMQLLVPNVQGGEVEWAIETGTPGISASMGWTKKTLKPGDKIMVEIHPLKDGRPGGTLINLTLSDGKVLRGAALDPGNLPGGPPPNGVPPAP